MLYLASCNIPSSSHNIGSSTVIPHELELFYDTLVVCGCLKCQGLKENPWCVTLTHYTNDRLPNVDGLIPPTIVKSPIGDIENTHRNTSLCSFFEKLESKTTAFRPKLTNPSALVQSIESSSDIKSNTNASQNISTRRSIKLHDLRENMSNGPIVGG